MPIILYIGLIYFFCTTLERMTNRLYIGRLSDRARERDIEDFLRGYVRVRDIILKNGYGFQLCGEFKQRIALNNFLYSELTIHANSIYFLLYVCWVNYKVFNDEFWNNTLPASCHSHGNADPLKSACIYSCAMDEFIP